jgi:hypothetical protein
MTFTSSRRRGVFSIVPMSKKNWHFFRRALYAALVFRGAKCKNAPRYLDAFVNIQNLRIPLKN